MQTILRLSRAGRVILVSPVPNAVAALRKHPSLPLPMCKCVCWAEQAVICHAECGEGCRMRQHLVAQACTQQLEEVCPHPYSLQKGIILGCPGLGESVLGKGPSPLSWLYLWVGCNSGSSNSGRWSFPPPDWQLVPLNISEPGLMTRVFL